MSDTFDAPLLATASSGGDCRSASDWGDFPTGRSAISRSRLPSTTETVLSPKLATKMRGAPCPRSAPTTLQPTADASTTSTNPPAQQFLRIRRVLFDDAAPLVKVS